MLCNRVKKTGNFVNIKASATRPILIGSPRNVAGSGGAAFYARDGGGEGVAVLPRRGKYKHAFLAVTLFFKAVETTPSFFPPHACYAKGFI